jgi:G3E family GTPase
MSVKLIFVGGFLGAGKTTLLASAGERLVRQGKRVGLITNDQAANLVDTAILKTGGFETGEVAGGCFCCRINDLLEVSDRLVKSHKPDVVIGEPVGSCTDISATVLNPLKDMHASQYSLAPFSVLADPGRLREALAPACAASFPDSVLYIFRNQLEEADAIVLNKADLLSDGQVQELRKLVDRQYPGRPVFVMSAATGEGVDAWLDFVMTQKRSGQRIVPVDYKTYADGEAALGWLNAKAALTSAAPADWKAYCAKFLELLEARLRERSAEIAHAKLLLTAPSCLLMANITECNSIPAIRGQDKGTAREAQLIVNARVNLNPTALREVVEACLQAAGNGIRVEIQTLEHFAPAPPTPVHRYKTVVEQKD